MSIRPRASGEHVIGKSISSPHGGFWSKLLVSPRARVVEAPTPEVVAPLRLPPTSLQSSSPKASTNPTVYALFPSHLHDLDRCCMLTFVAGESVNLCMGETEVHCDEMTTCRTATVDRVVQRDMEADEGCTGHVFNLSLGSAHVLKIETVFDETQTPRSLVRVAIVQAAYSPLLVAANFAPPSSMLVFNAPTKRLDALKAVKRQLCTDAELCYAPTEELVISKQFGALKLDECDVNSTETTCADWQTTLGFLKALSSSTADLVDEYSRSELVRVGVAAPPSFSAWREFIP